MKVLNFEVGLTIFNTAINIQNKSKSNQINLF